MVSPPGETLNNRAVRPKTDHRKHDDHKHPSRSSHPTARLESDGAHPRVPVPNHPPQHQHEAGEDGGEAQGEEKGHRPIESPECNESENEPDSDQRLFGITQGIGPGPASSSTDSRAAGAHVECVIWAVGDAIEALHTALIDHHPEIANFLVHPDVGGADGRAGRTALAGIGDPNTDGSQSIGQRKGRTVRAAVGAIALGPEDKDHEETADEEGQHGDGQTRECRPELTSHELRGDRSERIADRNLVDRRPQEHVDKGDDGNRPEQAGAQRPRSDPDFDQQPSAEILERDEVTAPAAEKPTEEDGHCDRRDEEDQTGVHDPVFGELHALGWLDGAQGRPLQQPLGCVGDHHDVDRNQREGAPPRRVLRSQTSWLDHREGRRGRRRGPGIAFRSFALRHPNTVSEAPWSAMGTVPGTQRCAAQRRRPGTEAVFSQRV